MDPDIIGLGTINKKRKKLTQAKYIAHRASLPRTTLCINFVRFGSVTPGFKAKKVYGHLSSPMFAIAPLLCRAVTHCNDHYLSVFHKYSLGATQRRRAAIR